MARKRSGEYDALVKEYRKLAKRADQRLVRLEGYSKQKGMGNALKWAYKNAQRNIRHWSGEKAKRFNTKPPSRIDQLRAKIRDIEKFLASKASTKKGIKSVYKQRLKTYKDKYGLSFKEKDLDEFFNSEEFLRAAAEKDGYTSSTYMRAIGEIQDNEKNIKDAIKKGNEINLNIDDAVVKETIDHLIGKYGKDVVDLY